MYYVSKLYLLTPVLTNEQTYMKCHVIVITRASDDTECSTEKGKQCAQSHGIV